MLVGTHVHFAFAPHALLVLVLRHTTAVAPREPAVDTVPSQMLWLAMSCHSGLSHSRIHAKTQITSSGLLRLRPLAYVRTPCNLVNNDKRYPFGKLLQSNRQEARASALARPAWSASRNPPPQYKTGAAYWPMNTSLTVQTPPHLHIQLLG